MRSAISVVVAAVMLAAVAGCFMMSQHAKGSCYVCPMCHVTATSSGACPMCKQPMVQMHILGIKDGTVYLCSCPADCKCTLDPKDMTKCACGKPVVTASLKGKYVCSCGETCKCNEISDKPGKCGCGKDMVLVQ